MQSEQTQLEMAIEKSANEWQTKSKKRDERAPRAQQHTKNALGRANSTQHTYTRHTTRARKNKAHSAHRLGQRHERQTPKQVKDNCVGLMGRQRGDGAKDEQPALVGARELEEQVIVGTAKNKPEQRIEIKREKKSRKKWKRKEEENVSDQLIKHTQAPH